MAEDRPHSPDFGDSNLRETQPASGFTPLPPIRRTSTFDLMSRKKLGSDEDDSVPSPVGSSDNESTPPAPPVEKDADYQNGNEHTHKHTRDISQDSRTPGHSHNNSQNLAQAPFQQHSAPTNGLAQNQNGIPVGRGGGQPNGFQQPMMMDRGGPSAQPNQFGPVYGQPNAPRTFVPAMAGYPIKQFPPGPWKLEESQLSKPLIQHRNRAGSNSPSQQHQENYGYEKETEDLSVPKGPGMSQTRLRGNSGSTPPVSAKRYEGCGLFIPPHPHGLEQSHGQIPHSRPPGHPFIQGQANDMVNQGGARSDELNKEMDIQIEEVSVSSVTSDDQPKEGGRRGSGIFSLSNRRNTGSDAGSQHPDQNGKEKRSFFSSHDKYQPKQKSNLGVPKTSMWDHDEGPEPASMKKRLSELRGMIKGVANAKDGLKDEQSARPSPQGPVRAQTGFPPSSGPSGQQGPMGMGRGNGSGGGPRPAENQHARGEDEHDKKHGGGFLGGLFNTHNKPGVKGPESRPPNQPNQPNQQMPPPGHRPLPPFPTQPGQPGYQARPGQMPSSAQPLNQHPMYTSQRPPIQEGLPGPQGIPRSMQAGPLNTLNARENNMASPVSPQFFGMAQAVAIRRPSEITVSTQSQQGSGTPISPLQRPQIPYKQGSQPNTRPSTAQGDDGSRERFNGSPVMRTTPNRKPVGSGTPGRGGTPTGSTPTKNFMPQAIPNDSGSQPGAGDDDERLSSQLPSGQQSPTLGKLGHVRQTSLPSPGHPPMLPQPGQVNSPGTSGSGQFSPRGPMSLQDRQLPGLASQGLQGRPGMSPPGQGPLGWVPNGPFANSPPIGPYQHMTGGPSNFVTNAPESTLSKFFGVDTKGRNIETTPPPTKELKEKEKSAASKFLGAFKRGSKQSEPNSQPRQQQRPPPGHQIPPNMMRAQHPGQGPQISGPSPAGPLGPMTNLQQGSMRPGQGRGQLPPGQKGMVPPMMHGAVNGPVPPQMQMGMGRGQNPQMKGAKASAPGQQRRASKQQVEPRYDVVPIPRGYEAVHGYGNPGMIAPSPYNIGRPSPPAASLQQFQTVVPPGAQQPRWDSRGAPNGQFPTQPGQPGLPTPSIQGQHSSGSVTPTPSDQGTFLDMAPTPPPPRPHDRFQYDHEVAQNASFQARNAQASHQPQITTHINNQQEQNLEAPTPSSSNWGSAPDSVRTPKLQSEAGQFAPHGQPKPTGLRVSPPNDNDVSQRAQPQHIVTAMNTAHPTILQPGSPDIEPFTLAVRPFQPARVGESPHPSEGSSSSASRLVSKMSTVALNNNANEQQQHQHQQQQQQPQIQQPQQQQPPRINNNSLSPDIMGNRAMTVSPEPPPGAPGIPVFTGYGYPMSSSSIHDSADHLNISISRADDNKENGDIYDATPRMGGRLLNHPPGQNQAQWPGQEHTQQPQGLGIGLGREAVYEDNTKYAGSYAGSERSRKGVNGAGSAAAATEGAASIGAGGGVVMRDAGFGDPDSDRSTPSPAVAQIQIQMHPAEPEEKILVDQPVELAAVNDDDDGMPVMSATSYPGQEWNPYGAGEFGDWE